MGLERCPDGRHLLSFTNGRLHFCEGRISRHEAKQENGDSPEARANQTQADDKYECSGNREQGSQIATTSRRRIPRDATHGNGGQEAGHERCGKQQNISAPDRIRCWRGRNTLRLPAAINSKPATRAP